MSDIQDRLNTYRSSSSFQIYEENHALVLNWNRFTLPILRSISRRETHEIGSRFHRKKTVVVIANRDKGEMDREIESFGGFQNLNVIARSGSPMNRLNLESASAGKASEVIVLRTLFCHQENLFVFLWMEQMTKSSKSTVLPTTARERPGRIA